MPREVSVAKATAEVASRDPIFAEFIARAGPAEIRFDGQDHLYALVRSIVYQQLAGAAAAAIHARFVTAIGGTVTPEAIIATPEAALRGAGLSGGKTASLQDLAMKVLD